MDGDGIGIHPDVVFRSFSVDHPLYTFEFDKNALEILALEEEGAPRVYGR